MMVLDEKLGDQQDDYKMILRGTWIDWMLQ